MKNNIILITFFTCFFFYSLIAQIESTQCNFNEFNPKLPPLSINKVLESETRKIEFDGALPNAYTPYFKHSINPLVQPSRVIARHEAINLQTLTFKPHKLFEPSDTFNKKRFWALTGALTTTYAATVIALNQVWYAQYPRSRFHFFDDRHEWADIDKAGHIMTAYNESKLVANTLLWTGMKNRTAALAGMTVGTFLQGTLEVLDGFSTEWGFSWSDIAANTSGCALYGIQQAVWDEQRIILKISNTPRVYSDAPIRSTDDQKTSSLRQRTDDLYGKYYFQTFFKDYNAVTYWVSVNPKSFAKNSRFPNWLNIGIGYGADNMYGGYANGWTTGNATFVLSEKDFPRYRQLYLSLDIDLSKIKTKSKAVNAILHAINIFKIPSPTIEFNSLNQIRFHPLFF